jgi:hypothetical protein
MLYPERTSRDWYQEAARCYLEGHQACAWCGGAHQVYKVESGRAVEYYCSRCDFHAGHDPRLDHYDFVPGLKQRGCRTPDTMIAH